MQKRNLGVATISLGGAILLVGLMIGLATLPGTAQEAGPSVTADSQNFQLLGTYGGTTGFVGEAINASGNRAYAAFDGGLQVLDVGNPAAVNHLGGRATPQGSVNAVERDGGLLYVAVDRPSGSGGDYVELLSTEPVTGPKLLGAYHPASSASSILDLINGSDSNLYIGQSEGVVVLDRYTVDKDGNLPVVGSYATDPVYNLLVTEDLLVADTSTGVELLTPTASPALLGKLTRPGRANAIALVANTLYRATGLGLEIIDITQRANPVLLRTIPELSGISNMQRVGALLYTTQRSNGGVRVYYASDPQNLIEAGHYQDADFSAVGLDVWGKAFVTGNLDGMRILDYTGEKPRLQVQATGDGVQVNGSGWGVGQTDTFTQPFTVRLAQSVASLDLRGKCEEVLRILIALQPISSQSFDPFEVFVEVLDLSPTICEPARPQPVVRSAMLVNAADAAITEARIDLRLDSGGLQVGSGDFPLFQNVKTPVAIASSRGQNSFTIQHDATSGATTVHALIGGVTVTPVNSALAPVTLTGGQTVSVTATSMGEVNRDGGVFLPSVVR